MMISVLDRIESIVGKGEIAITSNFYLSHDVFKRLLSQIRQKVSLCGNGFMDAELCDDLLFPIQSRLSTTLDKKAFENTLGKGETAVNQHFLLFPQCFLLYQGHKSSF